MCSMGTTSSPDHILGHQPQILHVGVEYQLNAGRDIANVERSHLNHFKETPFMSGHFCIYFSVDTLTKIYNKSRSLPYKGIIQQ